MLTNLKFFNAGYCMQNEFLTGTGTFRWRKFHAVFASFEHPVHGKCLIDTGYGPMFLEATARLPGWIMRNLLFTPYRQTVFEPDFLSRLEIDPQQISHIFVSHFHADHIGGLSRFRESQFVARTESLQWLETLSPWKQLHHGFLPQLLPDNFLSRCLPVAEDRFRETPDVAGRIPAIDYWGDGSLILLDLPGHARGHTGYLLNTDRGRICYAVDSFWDSRTFEKARRLPLPARRVQYSIVDYMETQHRLREFAASTQVPVLACHCERTQQYVANKD
ncbi:MAG: MBL fold metallo-hydrolase [Planctomyces sp.]|nr:MBL fold metallo-hydrolase [Planctomyces sp.]